ncbi:MAG TPA: hypothetical protein QF799_00945 [Gammaproteobacteria bacterium]|jgi:ABC-type nickel/cobalt efflux system permease component RcnA|nr:hypothetical protein [Gammaproteobacteria bacterium]
MTVPAFRFTWNKSPQDMPAGEGTNAFEDQEAQDHDHGHNHDHEHAHEQCHGHDTPMIKKDDEDERATDSTCEDIAG